MTTSRCGKPRGRGASKRKVPSDDKVVGNKGSRFRGQGNKKHRFEDLDEEPSDHTQCKLLCDFDDDGEVEEEDGEDDFFFNVRGAWEAAGATSANKMKMIQQEDQSPQLMTDAASPDLMIRQLQARLDQVEHDNQALRSKYAKLKSAMTVDKQKLENDLQLLKRKTISAEAELKRSIAGLKEHIVEMEGMIIDLKEQVEFLQG